jgi:hypothetical protein
MSIEGNNLEEKKSLLEGCDATTLNSKIVGGEKTFLQRWWWILSPHLVKTIT